MKGGEREREREREREMVVNLIEMSVPVEGGDATGGVFNFFDFISPCY